MSAGVVVDEVRHIEIPDFCLIVLMGSTGAGKPSFAVSHFLPTEVIGSDWARGRVADDETDQAATADAFALVHAMAALRLKNRRLTVIDATNVRREAQAVGGARQGPPTRSRWPSSSIRARRFASRATPSVRIAPPGRTS